MKRRIVGLLSIAAVGVAGLLGCAPTTAYIPNSLDSTVSVIDTASNTVTATIPVGTFPFGVAVSPDGRTVYVVNSLSNNVSVIAAASNTVIGSPIAVGNQPGAFGVFITNP